MGTETTSLEVHPEGEQPQVDAWSAVADTYAGRVHVEWDAAAPVTPFGQLPFFIEYLKQGGLFDGWVADCPLSLSSPNAPRKRDLLGTVLLSVLAGHRRYAHITALRCDRVNPPLLGMRKGSTQDIAGFAPGAPPRRCRPRVEAIRGDATTVSGFMQDFFRLHENRWHPIAGHGVCADPVVRGFHLTAAESMPTRATPRAHWAERERDRSRRHRVVR